MNEKMNTGTPSLNQEELGKEEIKDSLENKMSEENKKYERNEEGEISFGSDAIEKGRQYLLKRLTDLSESMYEGDKENSLRVLNTKALVYMSKAREWFLKNPQRTWNDFAWEERSEKWNAYAKARKDQMFSESAMLGAFHEVDITLRYIEEVISVHQDKKE